MGAFWSMRKTDIRNDMLAELARLRTQNNGPWMQLIRIALESAP